MNILLALLFVLVGCENDNKPLWLSGSWKGTFKDTYTSTDPKTHFVDQPAYRAELFYKVSTNSGTVTYPTLGCTSNWVFVKTDNDTLFFEEKITSDKNNVGCVDKMQYKLLQLSKNEIAIIGTGKTANGHSIGTNGILAKVDYKNNATTKPDAPTQVNNTTQYASNKTEPDNVVLSRVSVSTEKTVSKGELVTKANNELVGFWESSEQSTDNYGISTTKIQVWEFKSHGKWIYDIWNNYLKEPIHGENSYSYKNNILSEYSSSGTATYNILWEDDFKSFTVESEDSFDGLYFVRVNRNQLAGIGGGGGGGGSDKQCGYCEGRGTVRCCDLGGFYKPDCLSQSVKINCMSNPTPCELRVTCCRCKGTGRY